MKYQFYFIIFFSTLLLCTGCKDDLYTPDIGTKYKVTFEGNWSNDNFPIDFPSNDHFSEIIGMTHNSSVNFFEEGELASEGMESMAETGDIFPLDEEILDIVINKDGFDYVVNNGPNSGKGSKDFILYVDEDHSLVTLVSMIAPSPDWFCGIKDFDLYRNGDWAQEIKVPMIVWDAGTDSGITYTANDQDTNPTETIQPLTAAPLGNGLDVDPFIGYITFKLRD